MITRVLGCRLLAASVYFENEGPQGMEKDMKSAFSSFGHSAALVTGALTIACTLTFGGPALAQGDEPAAERRYLDMIVIDELPMTTGEYARRKERIVWARCLSVEVRELGPGRVETYFEFEILETVKGSFANGRRPGTRFTIGIPGGEAGESITEVQPPFPKFAPGDEAVLLVGRDSPRGKAVISPTKSTYRVRTDADGRRTVTPRPTGMTLYRAADSRAYERMPDRALLEDFIISLRKLDGG